MKLKLNSWYVWLWNYTYSQDLPNNLCPMFWQLIGAILFFIPNVIFRIPINIINMFSEDTVERGDDRTKVGMVIYGLLGLTVAVCIALFNWLLWLFGAYSYDSALATIGGMLLILALFFTIRYFWLENKVGKTIVNKTSNNMIVNYTKAWYNNYCPKINWE
jgi:hypothetical protein